MKYRSTHDNSSYIILSQHHKAVLEILFWVPTSHYTEQDRVGYVFQKVVNSRWHICTCINFIILIVGDHDNPEEKPRNYSDDTRYDVQ